MNEKSVYFHKTFANEFRQNLWARFLKAGILASAC